MDLPPNSVNVIHISLSSIHPQHLTKYLNFDPKKLHLLIHFCTLYCISSSIRRKKHDQVITKAIHIFALPNQILWKSFAGMRKEKKLYFQSFFCFKRLWFHGKNRESSGSQATRRTEVGPFPPLTKPWTATSCTFSWLFHCPKIFPKYYQNVIKIFHITGENEWNRGK